MAVETFANANPVEVTISEAGSITLPPGVHEVTVRVLSGNAQFNTKEATFTKSPTYAAGSVLVLRDTGSIHFTSADSAEVSFEL